MTIYFTTGFCYLGHILVAQNHNAVCAILLGDEPEQLIIELQQQYPHTELVAIDKRDELIISQVINYIENPYRTLDFRLRIDGTAFQQRVWDALQKIPPGTTVSYTDVASLIGSPKAVRAVASACAINKLAVVIPCHRVIKKDGSLAGYRWGIERKRLLLKNEQQASPRAV